MKKIIIKIIFVLGTLISVLYVCHVIYFEVGKMTGAYVAVNAKITYVHDFVQKRNYSRRANGYIIWEYDGIVHESQNERSSKIDLNYGDKEGDIISIWVNKSNGKFEAINNKYTDRSAILSAIIVPLFFILVMKILTYKMKSK